MGVEPDKEVMKTCPHTYKIASAGRPRAEWAESTRSISLTFRGTRAGHLHRSLNARVVRVLREWLARYERATDWEHGGSATATGMYAPHLVQDIGITTARPVMVTRTNGARLRQLAAALPSKLDWQAKFLDIVEHHRRDTGTDEGAVEVLQHPSRFWRERHPGLSLLH